MRYGKYYLLVIAPISVLALLLLKDFLLFLDIEVSFALICIVDFTFVYYLINLIFSLQFFSAIYQLSMISGNTMSTTIAWIHSLSGNSYGPSRGWGI